MVKMDYRDLCGLVPSGNAAFQSPSSPSDLVDSSKNGMDPSNDPGSGGTGSGSDGNGGRSVNTSSRRRRLIASSPTGTQLISEFNAAADVGSSGFSSTPSSSRALDLEASATANQVRCLVLPPMGTPVATQDDVLIIDCAPVDHGQGTPSGVRRSASLVDNNRQGTSSSARRSISFVNNNGPGNRVINDLVMVSSDSQGSGGGGSGGRFSGYNGQFPLRREEYRWAPRNRYFEVGSSSRSYGQGYGPSNTQYQQGPEFNYPYPYNFDFPPVPDFRLAPNMNFQLGQDYRFPVPVHPQHQQLPPWVTPGMQLGMGAPVQGPVYMPRLPYSPPAGSIRRPSIYPPAGVTIRRPPGIYAPPGVTICAPPTSDGAPTAPETVSSRGVPVTIRAPPASEGAPSAPDQSVASSSKGVTIRAPPASGAGASASEQPEAMPAPLPTLPEATAPPPPPVQAQPQTQLAQAAPALAPARVTTTFVWPPTAEEDAAITRILYGPSTRRRRRLPVFQAICTDDDTSPSPPPPPPGSPPPPPPPPRSP